MTAAISVFLFGPGLPVGGEQAKCYVGEGMFNLPTYRQTVRFSELTASVGSFDHNQLQLSWERSNQAWMMIPTDKNAQKQLIDSIPKGAVAGLNNWKRATLFQSLVWLTVVYSVFALVAAIGMAIWQFDNLVTWVAGRVPLATEYKIGQSVLASLNSQKALVDKGLAIDAVKKIGDRLTKGSAYRYEWHVSTDAAVNAFALPGGIVIVNQGLIEKADSANEVAGVLAHEIQHVEQRHALKNMITSSGLAAAVMLVLGDANAMMMIMAHQVSAQYFSRQAESDADIKGVAMLQKNKINPDGLVSFFKKMQATYKGKGEGPEWLSSHPDTDNRIKAVQDYNKSHPCPDCETLKWNKKEILASLEKEKAKEK